MELVLLRLDEILEEDQLIEACLSLGARRRMPSRIASSTAFESTGTGTEMPSDDADPFVPAQQDVQDEAVDRVVLAVDGRDGDRRARLAVAVHAALALFVARRVPCEVVVDDRVEAALEVDAFGQAVGRDEDAARLVAEGFDARLALIGGIRPVTASTATSPNSRLFAARLRSSRSWSATYSAVAIKRQKTIGFRPCSSMSRRARGPG